MERIVRGATADEQDQVLDFISTVMGATREYFASRFDTCPPAQPEDSRIALVDGRIVSQVRVYRRDLRLRGAVIPSGHLAEVCTDPEFRRQGHGAAVLRDCAAYIGSQGWPLSCVVSGVSEFYTSEHWRRFPLVRTSLDLSRWRCEAPGDVRLRRFRRGDDDAAVAEIHAEYNRGRSLSAVRDADYWRLHYSWIAGEDEACFFVAERDGRPVGYCRARRGEMIEYGTRDGHADAGVVLIDGLVRAHQRHGGSLDLALPADETVVTSRQHLRYTRRIDEHLLLRVIDLKGVLDAALATSAERLAEAGCTGEHTIRMEVLGQKCAIRVSGGQATAEALPADAPAHALDQTEFLKLVFGATMEKDLDAFPHDEQRVLRDLFPPDGPVYWRADVV